MPFVDLLPALRASRGQALFYDHCHLTPAGNAIAAEQIADLLLRVPSRGASPRALRRDAPQPVGDERVRAKVKHSSAARPAEAMALAIGTAVPSASRPTAMP